MPEDPNKVTYFAQTNTRGKEVPFGIKRKDRARHMYVIGKTGMGKSTLLENMAIQDIRNGEGLAFIDPHGSTADRIMEYVPPHRVKDVIYFAPFDMDFPIAFNVMEDVGYDKRHLVVSGLLSAFRKIWVDAWSARMEYILSNTLLALLEHPDSTLLDVNRMLVDKVFRQKVVGTKDKQGKIEYGSVRDPIVLSFWLDEFAGYSDRYTQEATPAIQNKIGQFTSNPLIRNIVGQPKSSFDIRQIMDEKKILIINLSKGRVGEVNATLLGSMLVTKIYLSAMSRADVPARVLADLPNFYFYVDEFQNFANESFADILSEARKYKLNLLIAHQYVEQMEEEVRDAVFGNVGTTAAFRVGPFDAETLETIYQPQFTKEDLVNLGFAQIYLTLMIDGIGSSPFSATTLPPFDPSPQNMAEAAIASSRAQYGKQRSLVEENIAKRQISDPVQSAPREERPRAAAQRGAVSDRPRAPRTDLASAISPPSAHEPAPPPAPQQQNAFVSHAPVAQVTPQHHSASPAENRPARAPERSSTVNVPTQAPPGIHSLREAIAKATGERSSGVGQAHSAAQSSTPVPKGSHAPDLKAALGAIAPGAIDRPAAAPPESSVPVRAVLSTNAPQTYREAESVKGLPNDELRSMLSVDPIE